jgi:hypothetical protein
MLALKRCLCSAAWPSCSWTNSLGDSRCETVVCICTSSWSSAASVCHRYLHLMCRFNIRCTFSEPIHGAPPPIIEHTASHPAPNPPSRPRSTTAPHLTTQIPKSNTRRRESPNSCTDHLQATPPTGHEHATLPYSSSRHLPSSLRRLEPPP